MSDDVQRREPAGRATGELKKLRPLFVLATFILVTAVLYWARTVLIPIAVATLLAFLLTPLVTLLQRRGLRRSLAVALVIALAFSVLGGVGWVLTDQIRSLAEELPQYRHNEVGMSIVETRDHLLQFLPVLTAVEAGGTRVAG